ncbi:MAG: SRPBCC family protein [Micavibrio aeruginosavorus]|uniref:SRPBCC family protein n=1 Tax=Micavibrio aeruginosavorus TaxID=349221 RepID=A0A7T5UGG8_9BACT|nr:MAG: SRPBCC family protein [Micavibrio aeruginosavorus]
MKTFRMNKHLPWAPADIFRLLMDAESFPAAHPALKAARTVWVRPGYRDIEMDFHKASGAILQGRALGLRVTSAPPHRIEAIRTKGQIEQLKMTVGLNPDGGGGTDMDFALAYQTGQGDAADNMAFPLVKKIVGETLSRFEACAAACAASGAFSIEADESSGPDVTRRGRRKSGYQPS